MQRNWFIIGWAFDLAANSSLRRISLINYRDKDRRVNENDLPFNVGACMYRAHLSIDRSIDRSRASLTKKRETANNGERVSSVDRGWSERVCAWPPTTLWFSAIVAKSVQWSPPFAFLLRNEPRTQRLVATFCREQRAQVTFTHSSTRAPRSSNFQEDSRPSYIVSCYRVTSKSNLTWIIDDKISYEPNNSSTVHETLESIVYLTRDLKKKKERKKKKSMQLYKRVTKIEIYI